MGVTHECDHPPAVVANCERVTTSEINPHTMSQVHSGRKQQQKNKTLQHSITLRHPPPPVENVKRDMVHQGTYVLYHRRFCVFVAETIRLSNGKHPFEWIWCRPSRYVGVQYVLHCSG